MRSMPTTWRRVQHTRQANGTGTTPQVWMNAQAADLWAAGRKHVGRKRLSYAASSAA
jgi:hypothetical protein